MRWGVEAPTRRPANRPRAAAIIVFVNAMALSRLHEVQHNNPMFEGGGAKVQQSRPKPKSAFAEFKQKQDEINVACEHIAKSTRDIKDLIERYSRATKSSEEEEISALLDQVVKRTAPIAKECKLNIQRLNDDLKTNALQILEGSNELASRKQGIKASATKFIKRVKDYGSPRIIQSQHEGDPLRGA